MLRLGGETGVQINERRTLDDWSFLRIESELTKIVEIPRELVCPDQGVLAPIGIGQPLLSPSRLLAELA